MLYKYWSHLPCASLLNKTIERCANGSEHQALLSTIACICWETSCEHKICIAQSLRRCGETGCWNEIHLLPLTHSYFLCWRGKGEGVNWHLKRATTGWKVTRWGVVSHRGKSWFARRCWFNAGFPLIVKKNTSSLFGVLQSWFEIFHVKLSSAIWVLWLWEHIYALHVGFSAQSLPILRARLMHFARSLISISECVRHFWIIKLERALCGESRLRMIKSCRQTQFAHTMRWIIPLRSRLRLFKRRLLNEEGYFAVNRRILVQTWSIW